MVEIGGEGLKKILIVDYDTKFLSDMGGAIRNEDRLKKYEVIEARNEEQALEQYGDGKHNPNLVVLEMMLPKRSGFLVLEKIRAKDRKSKVIMVTSNLGEQNRIYAQFFGLEAYLTKPFEPEKLLEQMLRSLRLSNG
tara:strand:- start:108 stop:518 length:411 start_codon:yes stop_codon:yes gene_type:complete